MSAPTQSFISYSFIYTVPDNFKTKKIHQMIDIFKHVTNSPDGVQYQ